MPRRKSIPSYRLHKPSGQARVIVDGRHVYLGPYGSEESRRKYAQLITEPRADAQSLTPTSNDGRYPDLSINELLLQYLEFAESYYVKEGEPTRELENLKDAMRPLRTLYGCSPAGKFGPRSLKAIRQYMIDNDDLCRGVINARINRIRRIIKWAASEELIPPSVFEGLRTVTGLRFGRSDARETEPVRPVSDEAIEATLPFLAPQVADMVRLQRLTGMRPGSVTILRRCDIDESGDVWIYRPHDHKTLYLDRDLQIPIGPKGQEILKPYFNRPADTYLFSPRETLQWWHADRRKQPSKRRTPVYPCEQRRLAREKAARRRRKPKRPPRAASAPRL